MSRTTGHPLDRLRLPTVIAGFLCGVAILVAADRAGLVRERPVRPQATAPAHPMSRLAAEATPVTRTSSSVPPAAPDPDARPATAQRDPAQVVETPEVWPAGQGREEAFYACTACHGTAIVTQQGMSRDRWEASIDWMIERHGMQPPPPEERALIADYLAGSFPGRQRRGAVNPFLK